MVVSVVEVVVVSRIVVVVISVVVSGTVVISDSAVVWITGAVSSGMDSVSGLVLHPVPRMQMDRQPARTAKITLIFWLIMFKSS